jgi:hypothetical protein
MFEQYILTHYNRGNKTDGHFYRYRHYGIEVSCEYITRTGDALFQNEQ